MRFRIVVLIPFEETMVKPVVLYGVKRFSYQPSKTILIRPEDAWPRLRILFDNAIEDHERLTLESDGVRFTDTDACEIPFEKIVLIEED